MVTPDEVFDWFVEAMKKEQHTNKWKGSYTLCTFGFLSKRLHEEAHELSRALQKAKYQKDYQQVLSEAADVANFALFIAHNAKELIAEMQNAQT